MSQYVTPGHSSYDWFVDVSTGSPQHSCEREISCCELGWVTEPLEYSQSELRFITVVNQNAREVRYVSVAIARASVEQYEHRGTGIPKVAMRRRL